MKRFNEGRSSDLFTGLGIMAMFASLSFLVLFLLASKAALAAPMLHVDIGHKDVDRRLL